MRPVPAHSSPSEKTPIKAALMAGRVLRSSRAFTGRDRMTRSVAALDEPRATQLPTWESQLHLDERNRDGVDDDPMRPYDGMRWEHCDPREANFLAGNAGFGNPY
ncbi:uncharacterized protein PG986_014535 [Apiospora aurea]|uniref:Uncharacterized protein n=1 Tax=Apiospora aurea TaxID=335848 RepID=A0ABR1PT91_9PEZI